MMTHRTEQRPATKQKPTEHVASEPNQVWSWDVTYLMSLIKGQFYYLYLIVDVFSRFITGWDVFEEQNAETSSFVAETACMLNGIDTKSISLIMHSDNGPAQKGATILATLQRLGICPSFSRPSVSNDNPYSESLFKTLKYRPNFPSTAFTSLEGAKAWVNTFVHWYNEEHRHSAISFVTPFQRHYGIDVNLLERRKKVYEAAKKQSPLRWSGATRNWNRTETVYLNPLPENKMKNKLALSN